MSKLPFVRSTSNGNLLLEVPEELYMKLYHLGLLPNEVRSRNVGFSNYPEMFIQPWSIWIDWKLDGFDADIIKRVARTKKGTPRREDYEKIIHICQEKLRQLDSDEDFSKELNVIKQ